MTEVLSLTMFYVELKVILYLNLLNKALGCCPGNVALILVQCWKFVARLRESNPDSREHV